MRRCVVLLIAALALLLLGARPQSHAPVLPPSIQPGFQKVMLAVNQEHALGAAARITDISIQKRRVELELELDGQKLRVSLIHRGARPAALHSRYFAFAFDSDQWRGHRVELQQLAALIDRQFPTTPWFIPGTGLAASLHSRWLFSPLELSRRLAMTLFGLSWLVGLVGSALLFRRRPQG